MKNVTLQQIYLKIKIMKPTLVVLAAGMGSRYGGLKQLDALGPSGETIMDYSVFDAIRGGFGKVVFVIRKDFEDDFRKLVLSKYEGHVETEVVFQSVDKLPEGFVCPEERTKPWGTNHAVLMAKDVVNEPFCVINADDFYGKDAFAVMGKFLSDLPENAKNTYSMVGFRVANTLSENGKVSRGVCEVNAEGNLVTVVERTEIVRQESGDVCYKDEEDWVMIPDNTPVSMNVWGFTPDYFDYSEEYFKVFLKENIDKPKSEYYIPLMVNELITNGTATVQVLDTTSKWFGVTYAADRPDVVVKIQELVNEGTYPSKLFS
jgi:dTDP-glucose pyrophosphorylase